MQRPTLEATVEVWRPQGFEGLELEKLERLPSADSQAYHTDFELAVLMEGSSRVSYRGESWRGTVSQRTGPLLFMQSVDEVSKVIATDKRLFSIWTLRISPELMHGIMVSHRAGPDALPAFPRLTLDDPKLNLRLALATRKVIGSFDGAATRLERESLLLELVTDTVRHGGDLKLSEQRKERERLVVRGIKDYLREHFWQDVSLGDLAALTHLNKDHLLEVFKREVGVSPHAFQTSLRICRARALLAQRLPIAQVALDVGFYDQSHLNRRFKELVRVTPGQFQRDSLR